MNAREHEPAAERSSGAARSARSPDQREGSAWAWIGAAAAAVAASACCWLPIVLAAAGLSAVGVAGIFARWRWLLLAATALMLAVALVYPRIRWRRPASCCVDSGARRWRRRIAVVVGTTMITAIAVLPHWLAGAGRGASGAAAQAALSGQGGGDVWVVHINGLICPTCAVRVAHELRDIPGVVDVHVDHRSGRGRVTARPGSDVTGEAILQAIRRTGFQGTITEPPAHR